MIRVCEWVLPGHPDKFCDAVADALVEACLAVDPEAYCQVEVGVWSDQLWLSGAIATRAPIERSLEDLISQTGTAIGYGPGNHIDPARYQIHSTLCQNVRDPREWTRHVNDQAIVIGWAGYDARTGWMPPEHHLARVLGEALVEACRTGPLQGCGPDGKLILRLREDGDHSEWQVEHLLVTLQQSPDWDFQNLCEQVIGVLRRAYAAEQQADPRWRSDWSQIELMLNPNGPLIRAGSDGDNGQTGRKLVMDYYGPRVPLGGGALQGKHPTHIDRLAAMAAREAAVHAVRTGARECQLRLCYAPNWDQPIDIDWALNGAGQRLPASHFGHAAMRARFGDCIRPLHAIVAERLTAGFKVAGDH